MKTIYKTIAIFLLAGTGSRFRTGTERFFANLDVAAMY